jgi:hypothetical protein
MLNPHKRYTLHASKITPRFRLFATETDGPDVLRSEWRYESIDALTFNLSRLGIATAKLLAVDLALKRNQEFTLGEDTFTGSELVHTLGVNPIG